MRRPPFSSRYTVKSRADDGAVVDFQWSAGTESTSEVWATIQPLSPEQLRSLPEGLRARAMFACFTFATLTTAQLDGPLPDRVVVGGLDLEVHGGFNDGAFTGAPFPGNEYVLARPEVQ